MVKKNQFIRVEQLNILITEVQNQHNIDGSLFKNTQKTANTEIILVIGQLNVINEERKKYIFKILVYIYGHGTLCQIMSGKCLQSASNFCLCRQKTSLLMETKRLCIYESVFQYFGISVVTTMQYGLRRIESRNQR